MCTLYDEALRKGLITSEDRAVSSRQKLDEYAKTRGYDLSELERAQDLDTKLIQTETLMMKGRFSPQVTWVQDVGEDEIVKAISQMTEKNSEYIQETGSRYVPGPPKSAEFGKLGYPKTTGIYFVDPTGKG